MSQFHEHCGELPDVSLSRARSLTLSALSPALLLITYVVSADTST